MKACVAKLTSLHDFPDMERVLRSYSHKVDVLVVEARLASQFDADTKANPALAKNWAIAGSWSEVSRDSQVTELQARELLAAIADPTDAVLSWIMRPW